MSKAKYYQWRSCSVTDPELISALARKWDMPVGEAKQKINDFIDVVRSLMEINGSIAIRRFGVIAIRSIKNGRFFNTRTKTDETLPLIKKIVFKASSGWRQSLNRKLREKNLRIIKESKRPDHNTYDVEL